MKKNSKKNERRALIGALCLAAVIAGGSTFAWFTSKDEVTNRLTASADYGVSIVEDFTPPEDWLPGQKINKDVSAVNTGNVDAYVRLAILNDLKVNVKGSGAGVDSDATALPTAPTDEEFVELNLTAVEGTAQTATANAVAKTANSVSTLQAGGTLVWTPDGAVQPTDAQNVSAGDDVTNTDPDYDEADQFKPTKTGLYIFKRTVYEDPNGKEVKYSGYFYDKDTGKYYALETEPNTVYINGITVTDANNDGVPESVSGVKLATTKDITVSNTDTAAPKLIDIKWYKGAVGETGESNANNVTAGNTAATWIQLSYEGVTGKPILIDIELASGWADNWTYIQTNNDPKVDDKNDFGYFYYNDIVKAGNTTPKLIDSVTLDSAVTQDAYNDLVYDLSVVLDSVQIAKNEDQTNYTNDTIKTWRNGASVNAGTGKPTWN